MNSDEQYRLKYLKYKNKYLQLKNEMDREMEGGGFRTNFGTNLANSARGLFSKVTGKNDCDKDGVTLNKTKLTDGLGNYLDFYTITYAKALWSKKPSEIVKELKIRQGQVKNGSEIFDLIELVQLPCHQVIGPDGKPTDQLLPEIIDPSLKKIAKFMDKNVNKDDNYLKQTSIPDFPLSQYLA